MTEKPDSNSALAGGPPLAGAGKDISRVFIGGVVAAIFLLFVSLSSNKPDDELTGPLAPYVVKLSERGARSCRSAACTFGLVELATVAVTARHKVRYLPPPSQLIKAPPGHVFRFAEHPESGWKTWSSPTGHRLLLVVAREGDESLYSSMGEGVKVPAAGYVREMHFSRPDRRLLLNGTLLKNEDATIPYAGDEGWRRLRRENPEIRAFEFQPYGEQMTFELAGIPEYSPSPGDPVTVHFSSENSSSEVVEAKVVSVTPQSTPSGIRVDVAVVDAYVQRLDWRVERERDYRIKAFPESVTLAFSHRFQKEPGQLAHVPAAAVSYQGGEAFVWAAIDDMAVPVLVRVIESGPKHAIVTEKTGARGLPLRAEHWNVLPAQDRARIFRAAKGRMEAEVNKLLVPGAQVIAAPDSRLAPGMPIRSANAG